MRVVVLGGGIAGESFVAALSAVTRRSRRSRWSSASSSAASAPTSPASRRRRSCARLELLARARVTPGIARLGRPDRPRGRLRLARRDLRAGRHEPGGVAREARRRVRPRRRRRSPSRASSASATRELPYDHLVVATGSSPAAPPLEGLEDVPHWSSRDATSASEVPESLLVVGGGAVGCELAQFYARMGSKVTIVNSGETLLDRIDTEAGALLAEALETDGMDVRIVDAADRGRGRRRQGAASSAPATARARSRARSSSSRSGARPNVDGFGLEKLPVTIEQRGAPGGRAGLRRRERLGHRRRHRQVALHARRQVPGAHRGREHRGRRRARRLPRRAGVGLHRSPGRVRRGHVRRGRRHVEGERSRASRARLPTRSRRGPGS